MASSNPDLGSEGPQTDVAVRKALYYGMDREQLSKLAFFDLGSDISPSFALPERDADFIDPSIELAPWNAQPEEDRKSTRLNSSHVAISYAVFCLKKKKENDADR